MQSNQFAWVYLTVFSLFFFDLGLNFVWRSEPVSKNASRYACGFSVLLRTSEWISSAELTESLSLAMAYPCARPRYLGPVARPLTSGSPS